MNNPYAVEIMTKHMHAEDKVRYKVLVEQYGEYLVHDVFQDYGPDMESVEEHFEENYCGQWSDITSFAENIVDELGYLDDMPQNLRYYFDYDKFGRDLFINDYYAVHVPRMIGNLEVHDMHVFRRA